RHRSGPRDSEVAGRDQPRIRAQHHSRRRNRLRQRSCAVSGPSQSERRNNVKLKTIVTATALVALASPALAQERLEPFWTEIPPTAEQLESPDIPRTADGLPNIFTEWAPNWRTIAPNGI